jgi:hypothetical protein
MHKKTAKTHHSVLGKSSHRGNACKAIKQYCKTTKCNNKKYIRSSKHVKKECGITKKICKYTTCVKSPKFKI